jgi:hypothetical protein
VTPDQLQGLLDQYAAGIEAELALLRQVADVARQQHAASNGGDIRALEAAAERRDAIMRSMVTIEDGLRTVRQTLADHRDAAARIEGFDRVTARHREAAQLVNDILSKDRESLAALADAELARRSAVASLERGESTLACYRRVLAPPVASATLVNRRG